MDVRGREWSGVGKIYGQERGRIDGNGRIRITPRFLSFFRTTDELVALHCLPEGAMGIYPHSVWNKMRQNEPRPAERAADSMVFRRKLRRFGAFTQTTTITNQGRITIPPLFRPLLNLEPRTDIILVGCEIGLEIWNADNWQREFERLRTHELEKGDAEMQAELENIR